MLDRYVAQVRLLVDVLPDVAAESAFALKGGTAINLFYRDMPRLSVDIDLTWLPIGDRDICTAPDSTRARIAEQRKAPIQFKPAGFTSSVMRASVSIARSPTSTTRASPKRSLSFSICTPTVIGSTVLPWNTSTATGAPWASHNSPNSICSLERLPSREWPLLASGGRVAVGDGIDIHGY